MAIALEGLRTVIYPSPDLDAAKAWWTGYLGFGPYFDQPFYVGFEVGGFELGPLPDHDPADGALDLLGRRRRGRGDGRRRRRRRHGARRGLRGR